MSSIILQAHSLTKKYRHISMQAITEDRYYLQNWQPIK